MKKIIDVSGYGHSGKTAISEFLKDYKDVFSFPSQVEFELFRVQGGLIDLYLSVYCNWNLIRSRVRIIEFKRLVYRMGIVQKKLKPRTFWTASGHGYNQYFKNKFIKISDEFVDDIIALKQNSFWPYDSLNEPRLNLLYSKIKNKLYRKLILKEIYYVDRGQFLKHTSNYIHKLFNQVGAKEHTHVVLNNAFEPYNPSNCIEMVENSYSIIVDRDPRDIYASMINSKDVFVPSFENYKSADELKRQMVGFDDVNQFIARFKILKNNVVDDNSPNVLRIKYEDFILNHDKISTKILKHIGLNNLTKNIKTVFDINDSKKNVGIWKLYRDIPEIIQIEKELKKYCYQK